MRQKNFRGTIQLSFDVDLTMADPDKGFSVFFNKRWWKANFLGINKVWAMVFYVNSM